MLCGFVVHRLQCLQLSLLTRFPFHDSQVSLLSYKSLQERPKRRPRGRKRRQETARRRQDSAKRRQMSTKRCQDARKSDFGAIWARFWTPRGGKNLDFRCNCRQNSRFSYFSKRLQQRGPKGSKRRPPGGENAPQERPRSAQERPRPPQGPRPKSRPRGEKKGTKK